MKTGFTLIELLAVIVILAIIALIATPIVLGIIDDTKESAQIRSAEFYLDGVENAVMRENMNNGGNFKPSECTIANGNMTCGSTTVEVEVDGEVPNSGTITFEEGKITEVELIYDNATIVKNEEGNLVYKNEESEPGGEPEEKPEEDQEILITSLNVTYDSCAGILQCIPSISIEPSNATNKDLEFSISQNYSSPCYGTRTFDEGDVSIDSLTGVVTKGTNYACDGNGGCKATVTVKTLDGSNITKEVKFIIYGSSGWGCLI